jgi:putative ABC transport system permease protein
MAAEVAVALVLLMGTGLMLKSFGMLLRADAGFRTDHLLTFHMILPSPVPALEAQSAAAVVTRLSSLPGVASVGAATSLPPTMIQQSNGFTVDDRPAPAPGQSPVALFIPATPGYLRALAPPFLMGRDFSDADRADGARVVIVNQSLAQEFFPGTSALGKRITTDGRSREIVGVVGDMKFFGLGAPAGPTIYAPFAQSPFGGVWVAVRTTVEPMSLVETVRSALHEISPGMNPRTPATMETLLGASVVQPRFQTSLLGLFGGIALLLAAVGIYGVISYGVAQRTGEIGVRLALGASGPSVLGLIVRQGMMPVLAGLALGLGGSFALTRLMGRLLYEVRPTDPMTFGGVTLVLALVALFAAYLPARRAAKVDPMTALRHD